jgi:hypothetical protein
MRGFSDCRLWMLGRVFLSFGSSFRSATSGPAAASGGLLSGFLGSGLHLRSLGFDRSRLLGSCGFGLWPVRTTRATASTASASSAGRPVFLGRLSRFGDLDALLYDFGNRFRSRLGDHGFFTLCSVCPAASAASTSPASSAGRPMLLSRFGSALHGLFDDFGNGFRGRFGNRRFFGGFARAATSATSPPARTLFFGLCRLFNRLGNSFFRNRLRLRLLRWRGTIRLPCPSWGAASTSGGSGLLRGGIVRGYYLDDLATGLGIRLSSRSAFPAGLPAHLACAKNPFPALGFLLDLDGAPFAGVHFGATDGQLLRVGLGLTNDGSLFNAYGIVYIH